jgi:hypothetical protein
MFGMPITVAMVGASRSGSFDKSTMNKKDKWKSKELPWWEKESFLK